MLLGLSTEKICGVSPRKQDWGNETPKAAFTPIQLCGTLPALPVSGRRSWLKRRRAKGALLLV